ncbi:MAG TPA: hypothetical protein VIR63_01275, partial [Pontiella sp.]
FKLGYGSEWGASALIRATVPLSQQLASMTDLNLYSKRGVGVGQGFQWESPDRVGLLGSFYLKDEDPHSKYDQASVFGQEINEERYRFKLEHVERFDQEHYVNTRWNYLSDPAVLAEFFRREYRSFAQPENYASWVYGNHYIGSEAFSNYRLNDFYNNTDRGEYSFDLYRTKLKGTPLYLQSENSIAHLERVYTNGISGSAYDSVRLDSKTTLFLPQRYGWLSLVPRAGSRATYYSKDEFSNEEIRYIPDAGMELSFQATKVLSNRERWYGQGLRHKIEPYLDYIFEDSSVNDTNDLRQFDAIDALQDEEKVKIGLRNILQTKRNNRTSRFIDLDFYTHYLVEDHGAGDNFDSLFVDARMPLTKRLMVDALGECNWNSGTIPFFNTRIYYDRDDMVLGLEHLHRDGLDSLWTARADLFPESRVSFEGYVRYSDRDNDVEEIAATAYMTKCCMRYALGGRVYDDDEISVMFSIGLAAFPEARISSSL